MKSFTLSTLALLFVLACIAQVPDGINYQSVIRDSEGQAINNASLSLQFSVIQGAADGLICYVETHDVATNELGIVNVVLGKGAAIQGSFPEIDWGNGPYFLETAVDVAKAGSFVTLGTTQMLSVPYAINARDAEHANAVSLFSGGQEFLLKVDESGALYTEKSDFHCGGAFYDTRDQQLYETVQIGIQCWMAENLNFVSDSSWCYEDDPENCNIYGHLYTQNMAAKVCPEGWHLPGNDEWCQLATYVDASVDCELIGNTGTDGGGKLKATGILGVDGLWQDPNLGATNESGFTALPAGWYHEPWYWDKSLSTRFWSSTSVGPDWFHFWELQFDNAMITHSSEFYLMGFSVRCVKDQ